MKLSKDYYDKHGNLLEKGIQREICEWLNSQGYFFWRSNNVPTLGRFNQDGSSRFRSLPKFSPKGLPDILIVCKGTFIGIEVKRPKQKLRPEQAEFGAKLVLNGAAYATVHSLEEAQRFISFYTPNIKHD